MRPTRLRWMPLCIALCPALGLTCLGNAGGLPIATAWNAVTINGDAAVRPAVVIVADVDGDSKQDIVVGYAGFDPLPAAVFIFFQDAVDSFLPVQAGSGGDLAGLTAIALGDLDGDSHPDIVAACSGRLVYLHSGTNARDASGWSASVIDNSSGDGIAQWNDVAIGNLDNANGLDIVACNQQVGRLSWFVSPSANPTNGTGWTRVDIDASSRTNAAGVALGDIDSDGRIDVVSTAPGETSARVAWYKNPADPVAGTWTKNTIGNLGAATRVVLGDLNVDGLLDVVALNTPGRQVGWYMRPSSLTSDAWSGFLITIYNTNQPVDVRVLDVNADNQPDLVVATQNAGTLRWFTPFGVQTQQWVENNLGDLTTTPGRVGVGDIDGDGRPDVVGPLRGATTAQDQIVWFRNPL